MSSALVLSDDNDQTAKSIVQHLKSQGVFDEFRRECLSDVDTKPAFMNLRQRTEGYVSRFLAQQQWSATLNKNQLRESLRRQINESGMVTFGVEHLAEQVITPKAKTTFYPRIDSLVKQLLGIKEEETFDEKWPGDDEIEKEDSQMSVEDIEKEDPRMSIEETASNENMNSELIVTVKNEVNISSEDHQKVTISDIGTIQRKTDATSTFVEKTTSIVAATLHEPSVTTEKVKSHKEVQPGVAVSEKFTEETAMKPTQRVKRKAEYNRKTQPIDENYLSDVSSVHTSDLSDFDDRISLSSDEDAVKEKVKISLKEVKQMTNVASVLKDIIQSSTDDSDSNSKPLKKDRKSNIRKFPECSTDSKVRSTIQNEATKNEDLKVIQSVKAEEQSEESLESCQKPRKKLLKQRSETQQRYDASDLYKPRPVIASRRNRTSASDSGL